MEIVRTRRRDGGEAKCAIYFAPSHIRLNAESRDCIGDVDYIKVFCESNEIVLTKGTKEDFRVSKQKDNTRAFCCPSISNGIYKIPRKTKLYGYFQDGSLHFPVSEKYRNDHSDTVEESEVNNEQN